MSSELLAARDFADSIRFSGDTLEEKAQSSSVHASTLKDMFYSNELYISREVTPGLDRSIETVLDRLGISNDAVEAFVYASPDINAQCYAGQKTDCVIRFSSALIDILSQEEFEFVVGHELGHFLLSHSMARASNNNESIEFYIQQRAQEISADRLGLIACNSLGAAVKALIKTISGLNDQHLKFDIGSFLSQLKKMDGLTSQNHQSTHPSILVRCRALLWFSLNESYINKSTIYPKDDLLSLDKRIRSDLDKYVDSSARRKIDEAKYDLSMWMAAYEIVQDGRFRKEEQVKFKNIFGDETLEKLIRFLNDLSESEVKSTVFSKVEQARDELESIIPSSFSNELETLIKWS